MFAFDRDLLVMEPLLWQEVAWVGQVRARTTGSVLSGTLTTSSINLAALGVETGHIAIVDGVPMEILQRLSNTTATVSLVRATTSMPPITPANVASASVVFSTFTPQLAVAHAQILRLAGIEPVGAPEGVTEDRITNPHDCTMLECLGALHLIYTAVAAACGAPADALERADAYRERFGTEMRRVVIQLDLDGDGLADARRTLGVAHLVRG